MPTDLDSSSSPPLRARRRSAGLRISRGAALFLLATILIGAVGIDTDANLLIILFGLCTGAFAVSLVAGWASLRNLEITRVTPDGVMAGQTFEIRYQITNRQRRVGIYSLHIADRAESGSKPWLCEFFVPMLPAGRAIQVTLNRNCPFRGRIEFDEIVLATRFPFGLITKLARVSAPQQTLVYPALGAVRERRWQIRRWTEASLDGRPLPQRGDDEFYGLREYRPGDNPRRIHWRRSARAGQLVVREMARLGAAQIWCILDTRIPAGDADLAERLEEAVSCAATVACDAIESSCKVGLICNGEPPLILPPGGGRDYRLRVLRELALRAENHDDRLTDRLERIKWPSRWRGACLIFAPRANDDLAEAARMLAGRIGPVTTFLAGTPAFDATFAPRYPRRPKARSVAAAAGGARR